MTSYKGILKWKGRNVDLNRFEEFYVCCCCFGFNSLTLIYALFIKDTVMRSNTTLGIRTSNFCENQHGNSKLLYEFSGILLCDDKGAITSVHVAIEWKYWSKSFEYCIMAKGITRCAQKRGLFLHCTGIVKQELFKTLQDPGPLEVVEEDNVNEYQKALKTLDAQFSIIFNKPNKRNLFRNLKH